MARVPVRSSNISSVGFDEQRNVLEVEFTSGKVYEYAGISAKEHYDKMIHPDTQSVGSYFAKSVRRDDRLMTKAVESNIPDPTPPPAELPAVEKELPPSGTGLKAPEPLKQLF
jgi:hypothetical protein